MINQDYTYGKRWFPNIIAPYTPTFVPEPILTNAPRIEQMVQDGKLRISLQDAVDLALQNNLAIVDRAVYSVDRRSQHSAYLEWRRATFGTGKCPRHNPAAELRSASHFDFQHGQKTFP